MTSSNELYMETLASANQRKRSDFWNLLEFCRDEIARDDRMVDDNEQLVISLIQLRDKLADRFDAEETIDLYESPTMHSPHLASKADSLIEEHEEIYEEICDICEEGLSLISADCWPSAWTVLENRFENFDINLTWHESRENRFIQDAYGHDYGSE